MRKALEYIRRRIPDDEKLLRNGRRQLPRNGMSAVVLTVKVPPLKKKIIIRIRTQIRNGDPRMRGTRYHVTQLCLGTVIYTFMSRTSQIRWLVVKGLKLPSQQDIAETGTRRSEGRGRS